MKKLALIFILSLQSSFAQQVPQYTQWFWNLQAINPAFTGLKPCMELKTLYRNQWAGIPGSPKTGFVTFNLPIYTKQKQVLTPRQGIGAKFESDRFGVFNMNRFLINYAGHFNFSPDTRLSVGIAAGGKQLSFNHSETTTLEIDPVLTKSAAFFSPDAALGFWWNGKTYFLSLAFSELIPTKWNAISSNSKYGIHSSFSLGKQLLSSERFSLLSYGIIRIPSKGPVSLDVNLVFDFNNKFELGFGFRNQDAVSALFQYKINNKLTLAYSFDYVISKLGNNRHFSHELSLYLGTCSKINKNKTVCPLF